MWRIFKHGVNILFYPFLASHRFVQLLPGGNGREQAKRILDYTFNLFQNNVARLEECNKTGTLDEQESQMVLETWKFQASVRLTDESIVNWCAMLVLFPIRSFRVWRVKRRLARVMRTGAINTYITELNKRTWPDSG